MESERWEQKYIFCQPRQIWQLFWVMRAQKIIWLFTVALFKWEAHFEAQCDPGIPGPEETQTKQIKQKDKTTFPLSSQRCWGFVLRVLRASFKMILTVKVKHTMVIATGEPSNSNLIRWPGRHHNPYMQEGFWYPGLNSTAWVWGLA